MKEAWEERRFHTSEKARERRARIYGQHLSGRSFEEIAKEFEINKQRAYRLYRKGQSDIMYNIIIAQRYWLSKKEEK